MESQEDMRSLVKPVLITGSARGIGAAMTRVLGDEGYPLVLVDKNFPPEYIQLMQDLNKRGVAHVAIEADVTKPDDRSMIIQETQKSFGGLFALVNNAGIIHRGSFIDLTVKAYAYTMAVNLEAAVFLAQQSLPLFHHGGSMVFLTSVRAFIGGADESDYIISKSGMIGATKALAVELAPEIRVNAVAPYAIETEMISTDSSDQRQERIETTLLKRLGKPEDVANVVSFLISDKASFITGQTLHVNGGAYLG